MVVHEPRLPRQLWVSKAGKKCCKMFWVARQHLHVVIWFRLVWYCDSLFSFFCMVLNLVSNNAFVLENLFRWQNWSLCLWNTLLWYIQKCCRLVNIVALLVILLQPNFYINSRRGSSYPLKLEIGLCIPQSRGKLHVTYYINFIKAAQVLVHHHSKPGY